MWDGQTAVGWLILEDLATVIILVLLPVLFGAENANPWLDAGSRELFILAVVTLALGTALGAALFFDVSLALGAFLAGVVIGVSDVSQQVGAEVLPFREIFAGIFFVSVGMLVNPAAVAASAGQVLALTAVVILGKGLLTLLLGLVLPASARTMLVVAAGLGQIGEFSFLVGQAGVRLGVLSAEQYGLILAAALLSIVANPLLFRTIPGAERQLQRMPRLWRRLDVPILVVEQDMPRAVEFQQRGVPTLAGDAANSEILTHASLDTARALVVTISDENAAELVVAAAHELAPELRIIARAATTDGVHRLAKLGSSDVIHPELEGGLEIVRHALLALGYPMGQVQQYIIDTVRKDSYDATYTGLEELYLLDQLVATVRGLEIAWRAVETSSPLADNTLAKANNRAQTGASVIALVRNHQVQANPKSSTVFQPGDLVGLIGEPEQISLAERLIAPTDGVTKGQVPNQRSLRSLARLV